MKTKVSLIKIVKYPINKNCWLSVENNLELRQKHSEFIQDYDFIDFEGKVFYYDILDSISDCFTDEFIYTGKRIISNSVEIEGVSNFVVDSMKETFSSRFNVDNSLLKIDIITE